MQRTLPVTRLLRLLNLAAVLGLSILAGPARAEGPKPDPHDPKARQLLEEVVKVYKGLPAYADKGVLSVSARIGDERKQENSKRSISFARPNKIVLDYGI